MAAPTAALRVQQTAEPAAPLASKTEEPMGRRRRAQMAERTAAPMAERTAEQMAAPLAEDSVLARLIAVDRDLFADQYWGQQPLLSPAADLPAGFTELLDADAIDELVSQRGLRTPFLRVAKNGTTLADKAFTAPGGVGAGIADQVSDDRLVRLFADGSTLVLQALHRVWPPILEFCQQLAAELGHPVQANAYVTPRRIKASAPITTYTMSSYCRSKERSGGGFIRLSWSHRFAISPGTIEGPRSRSRHKSLR